MSSGHQSARFGGICTPTSGMSRRASATSRRMSSMPTGVAHAGSSRPLPPDGVIPVRHSSRAAASAICPGSRP
jgi:hypothetical protein